MEDQKSDVDSQEIDLTLWAPVEQKYEIEEIMGEGGFGQVAQAKNKATGEIVAIKMIKDVLASTAKAIKIIGEI